MRPLPIIVEFCAMIIIAIATPLQLANFEKKSLILDVLVIISISSIVVSLGSSRLAMYYSVCIHKAFVVKGSVCMFMVFLILYI